MARSSRHRLRTGGNLASLRLDAGLQRLELPFNLALPPLGRASPLPGLPRLLLRANLGLMRLRLLPLGGGELGTIQGLAHLDDGIVRCTRAYGEAEPLDNRAPELHPMSIRSAPAHPSLNRALVTRREESRRVRGGLPTTVENPTGRRPAARRACGPHRIPGSRLVRRSGTFWCVFDIARLRQCALSALALALLVSACGARTSLDEVAAVDPSTVPDAPLDACTKAPCPPMSTWDAVACACATACPGDPGGQATIASLDATMTPAVFSTAIAARAGYVYWTAQPAGFGSAQGAVFRVSRCGGGVTTIATNQTGPSSIAVYDSYVYWGTNGNANTGTSIGQLQRAPVAGGPATTLATGVAELSVQFTLDAHYAYSTGFQSSTGFPSNTDVWRAPLAGGPETMLSPDLGNYKDIAVDETEVFLSAQMNTFLSQIVSAPIGGGPVTVLVPSGVDVSDLMVIDSHHIYYQADPPTLMRVDKDGTGALALAPAEMNALAVDGQYAYWLEGNGTAGIAGALKRVSTNGGATTTVSQSGGVAIALDDTYVYWASGQNEIYRLPK